MKNIEKYKNDLKSLLQKGNNLDISIKYECYPENIATQIEAALKDDKKVKEYISKILPFKSEYQSWYSESLVLIKQLLPDRLADFIKLFEKPKTRKEIKYGNYVIEDYLQNLRVTNPKFGEVFGCLGEVCNFAASILKFVTFISNNQLKIFSLWQFSSSAFCREVCVGKITTVAKNFN